MPRWIAALLFLALPGLVQADCGRENLIESLGTAERATLEAEVARHPYPRGNLWRATRGETVVHVAGSMHLADARHQRLLDRLDRLWPGTELLVMEMGSGAEQDMLARISAEPELAFLTEGPTLIDLLAPETWALVEEEMQARGVPGFLAAKFQPWYATLMLMLPACAMEDLMAGAQGLDQLAEAAATAAGVPVMSLDDVDILFDLFGSEPRDEQIRQLSAVLAGGLADPALHSTTFEAYFAEEHRLLWEFSRAYMPVMPGYSRDEMDALFAELEQVLLVERNKSWMDRLLPALDGKRRVVVVVGAAHLSGTEGLLYGLERAGFALEREPL